MSKSGGRSESKSIELGEWKILLSVLRKIMEIGMGQTLDSPALKIN
jgi:hypothetical protein